MKRIYLEPGEKIHLLTADARVGASGTVVDISLDLSKGAIQNNTGSDGIGDVIRVISGRKDEGAFSFPVYVEDDSGRLYFYEEQAQ